jgi:ABC-2 type transporter
LWPSRNHAPGPDRSQQPEHGLYGACDQFRRITPQLPDTGNRPYLDFMAPGILAQSVLFVAIFYGISAIWKRDLGVVHKLLVTPTPRSALILGKALSAGVRGLSQAAIIYASPWFLESALAGIHWTSPACSSWYWSARRCFRLSH